MVSQYPRTVSLSGFAYGLDLLAAAFAADGDGNGHALVVESPLAFNTFTNPNWQAALAQGLNDELFLGNGATAEASAPQICARFCRNGGRTLATMGKLVDLLPGGGRNRNVVTVGTTIGTYLLSNNSITNLTANNPGPSTVQLPAGSQGDQVDFTTEGWPGGAMNFTLVQADGLTTILAYSASGATPLYFTAVYSGGAWQIVNLSY